MTRRIVSLFFFTLLLSTPASAVVDYEGVDWKNPDKQDFVATAYLAVYGSLPSAETLGKNASNITSSYDRLRFVKWLLWLPEYRVGFGTPEGDYAIYASTDMKDVAVSRDPLTQHTHPLKLDFQLALQPARLLASYYGGNSIAAASDSREFEKNESIETGSHLGGRVYHLFRAYDPKEVYMVATLTDARTSPQARSFRLDGDLRGSEFNGHYSIFSGQVHLELGHGLSLSIDPNNKDQKVQAQYLMTGNQAEMRVVRIR